jgi:hypothetical protein
MSSILIVAFAGGNYEPLDVVSPDVSALAPRDRCLDGSPPAPATREELEMEPTHKAHVLVVTYKMAATPALLQAIHDRSSRGPCHFSLLVPNEAAGLGIGPHQLAWQTREGSQRLALALPLMEEAAGSPVDGWVSTDPSVFDVVERAVQDGDYDEIIVSTLPHRISHWLHIDLAGNLAKLGLPVTTVTEEDNHLQTAG